MCACSPSLTQKYSGCIPECLGTTFLVLSMPTSWECSHTSLCKWQQFTSVLTHCLLMTGLQADYQNLQGFQWRPVRIRFCKESYFLVTRTQPDFGACCPGSPVLAAPGGPGSKGQRLEWGLGGCPARRGSGRAPGSARLRKDDPNTPAAPPSLLGTGLWLSMEGTMPGQHTLSGQ